MKKIITFGILALMLFALVPYAMADEQTYQLPLDRPRIHEQPVNPPIEETQQVVAQARSGKHKDHSDLDKFNSYSFTIFEKGRKGFTIDGQRYFLTKANGMFKVYSKGRVLVYFGTIKEQGSFLGVKYTYKNNRMVLSR